MVVQRRVSIGLREIKECFTFLNKELMDKFDEMLQKEPPLGYVYNLAKIFLKILFSRKSYAFVERKPWTGTGGLCILKDDMWQRGQRVILMLKQVCFYWRLTVVRIKQPIEDTVGITR